MYVLDATPLIYLAKVEQLDLVTALPGDCCLPELGYQEVVTTGIEAGHADARRIERAVEADHFSVEPDPETPFVERLQRNERVSDADVAVLALAKSVDGIAVMDEQYGRSVADTEGITTRGTAYVVLNAQKQGAIDATESKEIVDALLDAGWYCAPDLYAKIRTKIEELA